MVRVFSDSLVSKALEACRLKWDVLDKCSYQPEEEQDRQTGRTTGLLLRALSEAILNRGKPIKFVDHEVNHFVATQHHHTYLNDIINKLGLKNIQILRTLGGIEISSYYNLDKPSTTIDETGELDVCLSQELKERLERIEAKLDAL